MNIFMLVHAKLVVLFVLQAECVLQKWSKELKYHQPFYKPRMLKYGKTTQ